ncbi:hypothetical protein VQH23_07080 [Pararoseomonas sp. SCSIO 73927]|uniref:hypothetical protein n=1 Tax=Pararoseomonas sp. SCSIO 73927 TaxID=3114537 RepID=UPI0030CBA311
MITSVRILGLAAALSATLAVVGAGAEANSRPMAAPAPAAERSADEAMYDARYGMGPRGAGQSVLDGSGATGGGGQHN